MTNEEMLAAILLKILHLLYSIHSFKKKKSPPSSDRKQFIPITNKNGCVGNHFRKVDSISFYIFKFPLQKNK